jgi:hypothetical protein
MGKDIAVGWARWGPLSEGVARIFPTEQPTILIVSLPRSGSSWVGKILGSTQSSMYLREPVNVTFNKLPGQRSFFDVTSEKIRDGYLRISDIAFRGLPAFSKSIVVNPDQWAFSTRRKKKLVIKEINPLALSVWIPRYQPKVIYLLRHPAAVANSFFQLKWIGEQFVSRFSASNLEKVDYQKYQTSFWSEHGALQAFVQKIALSILETYPNHLIVKYEELCAAPETGFKRIFDFCQMKTDEEVNRLIYSTTHFPETETTQSNDLYRYSLSMIDKWKNELEQSQVRSLMDSYREIGPPHYCDDDEW